MIGERIEEIIKKEVVKVLDQDIKVEMPDDIIETDNLGEVIEKFINFTLSYVVLRRCYLSSKK